MRFKRLVSTAGAVLGAVALAASAGGVAYADQGGAEESTPALTYVVDGDAKLPKSATLLSAEELKLVGERQSQADINRVIAEASETQQVQVLLDFDTMGYGGAVLVEESAKNSHARIAKANKGKEPASTASTAVTYSGVYQCSYTSSPRGWSSHGTTVYWCGSGTWSSSTKYTPWTHFRNGTSKNALVGPSNLAWIACPPTTTCTINPTSTPLGYVSLT